MFIFFKFGVKPRLRNKAATIAYLNSQADSDLRPNALNEVPAHATIFHRQLIHVMWHTRGALARSVWTRSVSACVYTDACPI